MAYTPQPVTFDGTNDNLLRGGALSGAADGRNGTMSFWFRQDTGLGTARSIVDAQSNRVSAQINASNQVVTRFRDAGNADICLQSFITMADNNWHHIIMTTNGTAAHTARDGFVTIAPTPVDADIDWTLTNFSVGSTVGATQRFPGDLADVWMDDVYIDISISANLQKFIHVSGHPADLGADGSTPTGSAPLVFFSGATNAWHTNKGTGGGYNLTGALTDGTVPLPGGQRFILRPSA